VWTRAEVQGFADRGPNTPSSPPRFGLDRECEFRRPVALCMRALRERKRRKSGPANAPRIDRCGRAQKLLAASQSPCLARPG